MSLQWLIYTLEAVLINIVLLLDILEENYLFNKFSFNEREMLLTLLKQKYHVE